MIKLMRRWWKYTIARMTGSFEANADPKVQLEQAITEAHEQHKRLTQQAANVIANQKQTEMRLNRALEELETVTRNARQAVLMADQATKDGDGERAASLTATAEAFANRMIALEADVEDIKALHFQASEASDQAKAAVQQNAAALQKKLSERQALLGKIDQAKMQEELNTAMEQLSASVGEDVPSLAEVRAKVEERYARAQGMSELQETGLDSKMLEVQQAAMNVEAQARLSKIRSQLGLAAAEESAETPAIGEATAEGSTAPESAEG